MGVRRIKLPGGDVPVIKKRKRRNRTIFGVYFDKVKKANKIIRMAEKLQLRADMILNEAELELFNARDRCLHFRRSYKNHVWTCANCKEKWEDCN